MQFYQRLQDIREDHDLSQTDIAHILNTTQQQYSRWENGAYQMPIEKYKILARYYNISIDYLSGLCSIPKTLDGKPYGVTKSVRIGNIGNKNHITINN